MKMGSVLSIFRSRVGAVLIVLNLVIFASVIWTPRLHPEDGFHLANESLVAQMFFLLNLPSMFLAGFLFIPAFYWLGFSFRGQEPLNMEFFLWMIAITLQWAVIGYLFEKLIGSYRK